MLSRLVCLLLLLPCACTPVPTGRNSAQIINDSNARIKSSGWERWQKFDDRNPDKSLARHKKSGPQNLLASHGWGISLAVFDGPNRLELARQLVRENHLENRHVFAEHEGRVEVFVGHYEKADTDAAANDLTRWLRTESSDGKHHFSGAAILPLPFEKRPLSGEPFDARHYSGYHTLLAAYYTEDFGEKWQEEAKRVVKLLRKEGPDGQGGVEAFYRINEDKKEAAVLVGLFTKHDHWVRARLEGETFFVDAPGPIIEEMENRFPFLLHNNKKVPATSKEFGAFEKAGLVDLD